VKLDRRRLLAICAKAAAATALWPSSASFARDAAQLDQLTVWGPPAGPSITVLHAIASGRLRPAARRVKFHGWRNPDEMRAGLTSGAMHMGIMPIASAANLFNRGLPIRLVNVMTNGLLYVISEDRSITKLEDLKGRAFAALFPNETPSLIISRLLQAHGIDMRRDMTVMPAANPLQAIQLLLAGRVEATLVPEPAVSAAIVRGGLTGRKVNRVIDVQKEWAKLTGFDAVPQAGLAVTAAFVDQHPGLVEAVHAGLAEAVAEVIAEPARAASTSAGELKMPWPVIEKSIPTSNLVAVPARQSRPPIEALLKTFAEANPETVGGKLPDEGFYLL